MTSWEKYGQNDGNMPKPGKEKRELFGNLAALQQACCNFLSLSNLLEALFPPTPAAAEAAGAACHLRGGPAQSHQLLECHSCLCHGENSSNFLITYLTDEDWKETSVSPSEYQDSLYLLGSRI